MKPKMWGILLQLGSNMWAKADHENMYDDERRNYRDYLYCDMNVWRQVTDFLPSCGINTLLIDMGEAVILDSHPELAVKGSLTKSEFRQELNRLRALGLTVLPKYNFSCGQNAWMKEYAYMVGTETYNRFCEDVVRETIELFDRPAFFHLGLEEESEAAQKGQGVIICRSPKKKMADAKRLFSVCAEYGVRPWIWVDPDTITAFGGEEVFRREMPKDVLLSNFYYEFISGTYERVPDEVKLYEKIGEWGFEQVPTSSTWSAFLNSKDTMRFCKNYVKPESLRGFMTAPWLYTEPNSLYGLLNDAFRFGNAKKAIYGEETAPNN